MWAKEEWALLGESVEDVFGTNGGGGSDDEGRQCKKARMESFGEDDVGSSSSLNHDSAEGDVWNGDEGVEMQCGCCYCDVPFQEVTYFPPLFYFPLNTIRVLLLLKDDSMRRRPPLLPRLCSTCCRKSDWTP
jgi:hypothetical protein